jgi:mRNA interferase MazF
MTRNIKHGSIWMANLNPKKGTEPGKTRPVLILQHQALLDAGHPSTLVVPLTTNLVKDAEPLRLRIKARGRLAKDSDMLVDQIRVIDNRRLTDGPLMQVDEETLKRLYLAVSEVMGMNLDDL